MMPITTEIIFVIPELALLFLACSVLVCDVFSTNPNKLTTYWLAQISLLAVIFLVIYLGPDERVAVFHHPVSYTHLTLPTTPYV